MKNKSVTKPVFIVGIIIILALGSFIVINRSLLKKTTNNTTQTGGVLQQTGDIVPTVDSSVQISLDKDSASNDVVLTIDGIPNGTQSVDYELSYQEKTKGLQGAIGTIATTNDNKSYIKKITLGTCSSGRCVYHEVVDDIKVVLKFTGTYGEKLFEKEYSL